ncbi:unnamed protein product, partial [Polarella glacialis]
VEVLTKLLQAPLGAVLQCCSSEAGLGQAKHPLLCLATSIPQLRDAVFSCPKASILPDSVHLGQLLSALQPPMLPLQNGSAGAPPKECLSCLKAHGQKRQVAPNAACSYCSSLYLHPKLAAYCQHCGQMQAPTSKGCCSNCEYPMPNLLTAAAVLQGQFCAKCMSKNNTQRRMGPSRTCGNCRSQRTNIPVCTFCNWCDVCSLDHLGYIVEGLTAPAATAQTAFKDTAKFMVTNSLEVFEASPVKMVELMTAMVDGFKGIRTCTIQVTPEKMKQLVLNSLLGSCKVLTDTFPVGEADLVVDELGSDAGTQGSFEYT